MCKAGHLHGLELCVIHQLGGGSQGEGLRWFQAYIFQDRRLTEDLVQRAERAGYKTVVLTVDHCIANGTFERKSPELAFSHHNGQLNSQEISTKCALGSKDDLGGPWLILWPNQATCDTEGDSDS